MTKEVKTGMMAFIVLVAAMAVFLFVRPKDWFDGNYFRMTASFSSVQGIKKGNEVRYAGVRVGEVSKISTEGNEGILEMRIKKDAQIPLDAEFTVSQSGVIGDYYVDIRGGRFDGSYFGEGMRAGEKGSDRLDQMMERAKKLMDSAAQMKENIGKRKESRQLKSRLACLGKYGRRLFFYLWDSCSISQLHERVGVIFPSAPKVYLVVPGSFGVRGLVKPRPMTSVVFMMKRKAWGSMSSMK